LGANVHTSPPDPLSEFGEGERSGSDAGVRFNAKPTLAPRLKCSLRERFA